MLLGSFLHALLFHQHHDRIADVIRVALDEAFQEIWIEEFVVVFFFCVVAQHQGDLCAWF